MHGPERLYIDGLRAHPAGFVLNTNAGKPREDDTRLQRVICKTRSVLQEGPKHFTGVFGEPGGR